MSSPAAHLDARSRHLLRVLIAQYLEEGQPVGSRTLSRSSGLDVSPATIRNIMSDLEELGLIASPHTSAGRVPTAQGLRLFVDSLLEIKPLPREAVAQMQRGLPREPATTRDLLGNASTLLSAMTHFVGVVTVPGGSEVPLKQIEFVMLDAGACWRSWCLRMARCRTACWRRASRWMCVRWSRLPIS